MLIHDMNASPIIIGGVGGSGTRVFGESLLAAGMRSSKNLNRASDALACTLLFKRLSVLQDLETRAPFERLWKILEAGIHGNSPLGKSDCQLLKTLAREPRENQQTSWFRKRAKYQEFRKRAKHLKEEAAGKARHGRWFLKEPNLHIVAPQALEIRPDLKFIMIVRHGVDMAFSRNQKQVAVWGPTFLDDLELKLGPVASLRYWCVVHRRIEELAKQEPERVKFLSFDQLCREPHRVLRRLFEFSGLEATDSLMRITSEGVKPPSSIGRRHNEDLSIFAQEDMDFVDEFMATIENAPSF